LLGDYGAWHIAERRFIILIGSSSEPVSDLTFRRKIIIALVSTGEILDKIIFHAA
jgi:hypothetical protein